MPTTSEKRPDPKKPQISHGLVNPLQARQGLRNMVITENNLRRRRRGATCLLPMLRCQTTTQVKLDTSSPTLCSQASFLFADGPRISHIDPRSHTIARN